MNEQYCRMCGRSIHSANVYYKLAKKIRTEKRCRKSVSAEAFCVDCYELLLKTIAPCSPKKSIKNIKERKVWEIVIHETKYEKFTEELKNQIATLSQEKQDILCDDLLTALENRVKVLKHSEGENYFK